jgi:hypothetical protein
MIAAMSTRPTRENRSTLSRMLVLIALTPPLPCVNQFTCAARQCVAPLRQGIRVVHDSRRPRIVK